MDNNVELFVNESGDWAVLKVNGKVYAEGHRIPEDVWLKLIEQLGNRISSKEVSDEDMENGSY